MLEHIQIRDFTIIDQLELSFKRGLTVMTGETGAGKSILIDALGLILGNRADPGMIRHGCQRAEICAEFSVKPGSTAATWLSQHEFDHLDECLVRRTLSQTGRSKAYLNGRIISLNQLREFGGLLIDIHGQHEHQSLMQLEKQGEILDGYADNGDLLKKLISSYKHWNSLEQQLEMLRQTNEERNAKFELLKYQVEELDNLDLAAGELQELDEQHKRLANANRLRLEVQSLLEQLHDNDEHAVARQLSQHTTALERLTEVDSKLTSASVQLNSISLQLQEVASDLRHYLDQLEIDPEQLKSVEQRLSDIFDIARKHHVSTQELTTLHQTLKQELSELDGFSVRAEQIEDEIKVAEEKYHRYALKLSENRKKAADMLVCHVNQKMQQLGMPHGFIEICFMPIKKQPSPSGLEKIEFFVVTNPGQPLKPLTKVVSGGELSRISLAIQVSLSDKVSVDTMVFDEVDVGIGGGVAEVVGQQLRALGKNRQVLCVTHLPQVAALGEHHFQVNKKSEQESTRATIIELKNRSRIEEISRMLGGIKITEQTRAHAREMIARAEHIK
ncbi:MAG TPA: DNA repair protein RecN [Gammaproteobacteria bacterium]|nr:DNA repair protein RecN [Gammaproteobacteria bacterium]